MKLNIFKIPEDSIEGLKNSLTKRGLTKTSNPQFGDWSGEFLFSQDPKPGVIPWVKTFSKLIGDDSYHNLNYYAVLIAQRKETFFAITFGKTHFYVRPFCDYDFGTEIAKRIADKNDVSQTSERRFQGKQKKDIRSFGKDARLSVPPGSSVDFIQSRLIEEKVAVFGETAKFGTSCQFSIDIEVDKLGDFLSALEAELTSEPLFQLPRTLVLNDETEVATYDRKLIKELLKPVGSSEISSESFDLFGVDFIFSSSGSFVIKCANYKPREVDLLTIREVKKFIDERQIPENKILNIKIVHKREGEPVFTQKIKEAVDFICDDEYVVLSAGKWLRFNDDYLETLNSFIRQIEIEEPEADLRSITTNEPTFNQNMTERGYTLADKNFKVIKTNSKTPTEAWDLQKDATVYAVKFGTSQKLNYVVDQAMSVLELIRNSGTSHKGYGFKKYCLWLGYRAKKPISSLADSGSIILKQKVEAWARSCNESGITPVIKLSHKINPEHDK